MKNYKKIVILTVLFAFLSILIYHYYINVCNTSIEFFNEKKKDKNPKKKEKNPKIVGEHVFAVRDAIINFANAGGKVMNESTTAYKVISNQPL
jgi:Na+-transporting methylmalonyl-CoA/oxaloacetate decarboxylase gamma subunit